MPHFAVCIDVSSAVDTEVKDAAIAAALDHGAQIFLFGSDPEWKPMVPLTTAVETLAKLEACPAVTAKCTEARVCQMLGYTQGFLVNTPWTYVLSKLRKEVTNSMARTMMPSPREYRLVYVTALDDTASDVYGAIVHDLETIVPAFGEPEAPADAGAAAAAPEAAASKPAAGQEAGKMAGDFMAGLFQQAMPFVQQAMENNQKNGQRKKKGIKAPPAINK